MHKQKIAVVFSGGLRVQETFKSIYEFFYTNLPEDIELDFFLYTTDRIHQNPEKGDENLIQEKMDYFIKIFNPKKVVCISHKKFVEDFTKVVNKKGFDTSQIKLMRFEEFNWLAQHYKAEKAIHLLDEYKDEYTYVFRIRPDLMPFKNKCFYENYYMPYLNAAKIPEQKNNIEGTGDDPWAINKGWATLLFFVGYQETNPYGVVHGDWYGYGHLNASRNYYYGLVDIQLELLLKSFLLAATKLDIPYWRYENYDEWRYSVMKIIGSYTFKRNKTKLKKANLDFIEFMTLALCCSVPPEGVWPLPGIRNRVWVQNRPCYFDIIRSNGEFEHYLPEKSIGTFKYKRGDSYAWPS